MARVKVRTKLTKGLIENGSVLFDFRNGSYRMSVSKILPYLWDKSWIGHLWGYEINGSLIFFPKIILEIRGANVKYQNCSIENRSVPVIHLDQRYNVTYYVRTSWKRSKIKGEVITQYKLLHLLKKPLYIFFYNGTFKAFKAGRIDFKYSTVLVASNNSTTLVFVKPRFYYSNFVSANATCSHAKGDNTIISPKEASSTFYPPVSPSNATYPRCHQDKYEFWLLAVILFAATITCLLYKKRK